jgi:hypothetical protein
MSYSPDRTPKPHVVAQGTLGRSKSEKGAPYYGRIRLTQAQAGALVEWMRANPPQPGDRNPEPVWELDVAAWVRDGHDGQKFFSMQLEQPYRSQRVDAGPDKWQAIAGWFGSAAAAVAPAAPAAAAAYQDDLPF